MGSPWYDWGTARVISLQAHFNPSGSLFRHFFVKRSPGTIVKTRKRALAGKLATAATQRCHEIILARLGPPLRRVISLQVYFNPFGSLFRHFVIKRSPGKAVKTRKRALGPESSSQQSLHSSWCHGIALTRLGPPLRRVISLQVHFNPFGSLFRHLVVKMSPGKAVKTRTRALVALRGGIRAGKLITALTSPWDRPGATGAIAAPGYHKFHVL